MEGAHVTSAPGAVYGTGNGSESSTRPLSPSKVTEGFGTSSLEPPFLSSLETKCLLKTFAFSSSGKLSMSRGVVGLLALIPPIAAGPILLIGEESSEGSRDGGFLGVPIFGVTLLCGVVVFRGVPMAGVALLSGILGGGVLAVA